MAKSAKRQQKNSRPPSPPDLSVSPETRHGILVIALYAAAALVALSIFDLAGGFGRILDQGLTGLLGWDRAVLPLVLVIFATKELFPEKIELRFVGSLGLVLLVLAVNGVIGLLTITFAPESAFWSQGGGYLGLFFAAPLEAVMGFWAGLVVLLALVAVSLLLVFNTSLHRLALSTSIFARPLSWLFELFNFGGGKAKEPVVHGLDELEEESGRFASRTIQVTLAKAEKPERAPASAEPAEDSAASAPPETLVRHPRKRIEVPLELLAGRSGKPAAGDIAANMERIRRTLERFGIPVEMGDVSVGPTVTQYTLRPAEGIKLSRITGLSNDLALALAAHPIRIEAPIPGKSLVGIEVPNASVATVTIKEVLESPEFRARKNSLEIALGKDVSGKSWTANLSKMPHLLVAGATGSGKSVCLNSLIVSLLYQNGPDDLRFILIDPKRVELQVYNGVPHLVAPVITDVPKTVNALKWTIGEMERRFDLLSKSGYRDIGSYNSASPEKLPYLVLVIDELADLMVAAAAEVESSIIRLAQMARAVGIHLVLATQRPSVDVITGLIKANITTRIAFAVASGTDSRTILDSLGAEKLLGRGDMLYTTADLSKPKRLQGCLVTDAEIQKVVNHVKSSGSAPNYLNEVTERQKSGPGSPTVFGDEDADPLLEEAQETVVRAGKASASLLQRRLKVGYARAARLLDLMEERGVIGPGDGAKPREILISREGLDTLPDDEAGEEDYDEDGDK
ncbi:DNA translocase FtsK [Patescibacteria group bacterium]|nr:MAG: DNA translocase FtsK [Patescibacteria group bacterium]